jgi:rubrerythrin
MSIVEKNLEEALQGESNAKRKYELYAQKAREKNLPKIAHLFKAISYAESIHIKNHLRALSVIKGSEIKIEDIVTINEEELEQKVKDTATNLQDSVDGEIYETKKMYKTFEKNAASEGKDVAELSFSLARDAEKVHADLFSKYLKMLKKGKDFKQQKIYVCKICGNVEFIETPEICPVCEHSKEFYEEISLE